MPKRIFLILLIPIFVGCATIKNCPSEEEEAVSTCRAENACGKGKFSTSLAIALGGAGSGLSHERNQALDNYNQCVDRNLQAQAFNSNNKIATRALANSIETSSNCITSCEKMELNGQLKPGLTASDCIQVTCN